MPLYFGQTCNTPNKRSAQRSTMILSSHFSYKTKWIIFLALRVHPSIKQAIIHRMMSPLIMSKNQRVKYLYLLPNWRTCWVKSIDDYHRHLSFIRTWVIKNASDFDSLGYQRISREILTSISVAWISVLAIIWLYAFDAQEIYMQEPSIHTWSFLLFERIFRMKGEEMGFEFKLLF